MTSGKQSKADRAARQAKIDAAAPRQGRGKPAIVALVVVLVLAALAAAVIFGTRSADNGGGDGKTSPTAAGAPKGATGADGGIAINAGKAKVGAPTLDIFEDFQCPYCGEFEKMLGPTIAKMSQAGEIKVVYHMKNFLDQGIPGEHSTRAANAAACAADVGVFEKYHSTVFAHMPAKEGMGYTDAQLEQFATASGISGTALTTWKKCVADKTYVDYIKRVDEASARAGVNGTPTYQVNGKTFNFEQQQVTSAEDFRVKVLAAGGATP